MALPEKKRGDSRKGQFTVFVIIGFVLLVVVGFTLFMVSLIAESNYELQAKKAVEDYLETSAINYYVYTCMDTAVKDAVITLGYQGGRFTKGDPIEDPTGIPRDNGTWDPGLPGVGHIPFNYQFSLNSDKQVFNVSYSIIDESLCPIVEPVAPDYPIPRTKLDALFSKYSMDPLCKSFRPFKESGVFGFNQLPRLCYPTSANFKTTETATYLFSPCIGNVYTLKELTIEQELAKKIAQNVNECVNFDIFQDAQNDNITKNGPPSARIEYANDVFSVFVEYPFIVRLENKEPVIIKKDFEYGSKLRLTALHNYLLNLVIAETQQPNFNLSQDYSSVVGYDPMFEVEVIPAITSDACIEDLAACTWKHDQVLVVKDLASRIGNQPLAFFTAIKNRKPALDFLHQQSTSNKFDIIVMEGDKITLEPYGIDPESGDVDYEYGGWKEAWDEYYDFDDEACMATATFAEFAACVKKIEPVVATKNWTKSTPYIETQKDAEYVTVHEDAGPHQTTIRIIDDAGNFDWQVVNILVIDIPNISIAARVPYVGDFGNNISVEDPFILDSTGSTPPAFGGATINSSFWEIYELTNVGGGVQAVSVFEHFVPFRPPTAPPNPHRVDVPMVPPGYTISNIHNKNLNSTKEHDVKLTLDIFYDILGTETVVSHSKTERYEVQECIPFRGAADPFPYNEGADSFFGTNHICCTDDYERQGPNEVCYQNSPVYGEPSLLRAEADRLMMNAALSDYYTSYKPNIPIKTAKESFPPLGNPAGTFENDVYELVFERKCDNLRGNICAGEGEYKLVHANPCADKDWIAGQSEFCEGPSNTVQTTDTCEKYSPGDSFEKLFGTGAPETRDGICNEHQKCSRISAGNPNRGNYDDATGPQYCQATCDGFGACDNVREMDCECSVDKCGLAEGGTAECDEDNGHEWSGFTCKSDCDLDRDCTFKDIAINNIPCDASNSYCFNPSYGTAPRCYYNVACTDTGPVFTPRELCGAPGTSFSYEGDEICIKGAVPANFCRSNGRCSNSEDKLSVKPPCPLGESYQCTNNGWRCIP